MKIARFLAMAWTWVALLLMARSCSSAEGNDAAVGMVVVFWLVVWAIVAIAIVQIGKLFDRNTKA